ncbi:hypothetical protein DKL51_29175 [Micromonospora globispora]|nr:hypothetical protein DKL51_29175 [Micromonospora globispora]
MATGGVGAGAACAGAAAARGTAVGSAGTAARTPRQCTNTARALWCRLDAGIRTNLRTRSYGPRTAVRVRTRHSRPAGRSTAYAAPPTAGSGGVPSAARG